MKLSDAIEQMFYEDKPIGVRCKLCGELLTYSAMNVADDPYGVKEHYRELHKEVNIDQLIHEANFSLMMEDGLKREVKGYRKRTGYIDPMVVFNNFGENSWYRDMLNEHRKYLRDEGEAYLCGSSDGKLPQINHWPAEDRDVGQHFGIFTVDNPPYRGLASDKNDVIGEIYTGRSIPKWMIWWKDDDYNVFLKLAKSIDSERYRRIYFGDFENSTTNDVKLSTDMNNKKNVSDNPYDGGTLYSVLRDRILEKRKLLTNATIPNEDMVRELLHTPMEELVPMLVQHELSKANAKFPPFADEMHGWAVLKEEIEEADEELVNIRRWHDQIWIAIRGNRKLHSDYIRLIRTLAQKMMVEAAQVAAMALKYEAMLERNEKKEE